MLRISELHREEFFCRVAAGIQGTNGCAGVAVENLCHDRVAAGIRAGTGGGGERDGEIAKPVDFESDVDFAEGSLGYAEGAAGVRGTDAAGVHRSARPCGERAAVYPRCVLHLARGRVLCLSEYFCISRTRRAKVRV